MGLDEIEDEDSAETEMVKLDYLAIVRSFEEYQMHARFLKSSGYVDTEKKDRIGFQVLNELTLNTFHFSLFTILQFSLL